jgi:murein DD-endopeptidase MepM/ murein hydrolase activator NlpD
MPLPPRTGLPGVLAVVVSAVAVSVPSPAMAAGSGGTTAPAPGSAPTGAPTGGTTPGSVPVPATPSQRKRRSTPRPTLELFRVSASRFYDLGSPAKVVFRIDGRSDTVRVKLQVRRDGAVIRTLDLGDRATGRQQSIALTGREGGRLPEGTLQLRLSARDPRGRGLRATGRASATDTLGFYWHRFPIAGPFTYSGPDGEFGAGRPGHIHQGEDLLAPEGTPIVAPRGGQITTVAYQAGGAGYYVVLRPEGEDRSYVFMHLLEGSTRVQVGQQVKTGERLGDVGQTGAASGPHLHFELWEGAWFAGGHAVDPLPELKRWDSWS